MHALKSTLLAVAPLLLIGCTSPHVVHPVSLKPPQIYRFQARDSGLVAGAEPYDTPTKASDALGKDVSRDFTPVQVVLESTTGEKFVIERAKATLTCANGTTLPAASANTMYQVYRESGVGLAAIGFRSAAASVADENDKMRYDWTEKEFPAQAILLPNEHVGGFLYFRGRCRAPGDRLIRVAAHNLANGATTTLVIELKRS